MQHTSINIYFNKSTVRLFFDFCIVLQEVEAKIEGFRQHLKLKLADLPSPLEEQKKLIRYICINCNSLNSTWQSVRYHGRWIDSVWKSRSYADALNENPINLYIF